jgi:hypothetical protein
MVTEPDKPVPQSRNARMDHEAVPVPINLVGQFLLAISHKGASQFLSGPRKTRKALEHGSPERSVSRSIIRPRFWGNVTVVGDRFKFFAVCACHFGLLLFSKLVHSLQRQDDHDAETLPPSRACPKRPITINQLKLGVIPVGTMILRLDHIFLSF